MSVPDTSLEDVRAEVAEVLAEAPEDLGLDEDLLDRGLDSIRLMTLVQRWEADGVEVSLLELAEDPTVRGWTALLEKKREETRR